VGGTESLASTWRFNGYLLELASSWSGELHGVPHGELHIVTPGFLKVEAADGQNKRKLRKYKMYVRFRV
jgi:hypothetical protein